MKTKTAAKQRKIKFSTISLKQSFVVEEIETNAA